MQPAVAAHSWKRAQEGGHHREEIWGWETNSRLEIQGRLHTVKGENFCPRRGHLGL